MDPLSDLLRVVRLDGAYFFAVEAAGLRWLAEVEGGARVPDVLAESDDCLVLSWVEAGRPSVDIVDGVEDSVDGIPGGQIP